jgi:hypothetical protein
MFDPTIHFGDILTVVAVGWGAYQKVVKALASIEAFMIESRDDRLSLHRQIDALLSHRLSQRRD